MLQLPPEVYSAIASYVSPRDLLNLCRTSRALQSAAEPKLYETVVVRDVFVAFHAVTMICKNDGERAPYVKRFILYQDPRRMTRIDFTMVPPQFWVSVQEALVLMVNLDYLVLHDPLAAQSWILGHEDIIFQLNELSARLPWDSHLVAFLSRQHKLRVLLLGNECVAEDGPLCPLPAGALSKLEVFGGPTLVAAELLACPLTRLQMSVEQETASILPTVVADLGRTMRTLRKLHVLGIPDALMLETLQLVSTSVYAPILRTLGVLPVTPQELPAVHRCLMKLGALEMVELDVSRWEPQLAECMQRAVMADFRIYCPSLRHIVFWHGQHRFLWFARDGEWMCVHQHGRWPAHETHWRT